MTKIIRDPITVAAIERASEADKAWFEEHENETVRHRPAMPLEFAELLPEIDPHIEGRWWVEVTNLAPGLRLRNPYFVVHRPSIA